MTARVLVAGIGNVFLGDDGFGVAVAQRMLERGAPAGVRVLDAGIRGFDLACALLEGWDAAILIDAVQRGGPPGTLIPISMCGPVEMPTIPQPTSAIAWPARTCAPTGTSAGFACP